MEYKELKFKIAYLGNFTRESTLMRKRYEERSKQSLQAVQKAMEFASRQLWRCDPRKHVNGT